MVIQKFQMMQQNTIMINTVKGSASQVTQVEQHSENSFP